MKIKIVLINVGENVEKLIKTVLINIKKNGLYETKNTLTNTIKNGGRKTVIKFILNNQKSGKI
mgnify:CR=1 FL=1